MYMNEKEYCENSSDGISRIGVAQCYKGEQEVEVTIVYDEHGMETDTLRLCKECADRVEKDAKKHGYDVERSQIE